MTLFASEGSVSQESNTNVFTTCMVDLLRPSLVARVQALFARRAVTATVVKKTTCCGQPAFNSGFVADARRAATPTLRALAQTTGPIVVPSGSCAAMIIHRWPELFADTKHATAARSVAERVAELSQALAAIEGRAPGDRAPGDRAEPVEATPIAVTAIKPVQSGVAWHGSCHAKRELCVTTEPTSLLTAAGCSVTEPADADQCCGFGGTFAVKFADVSVAMADAKLDALVATGCANVVGGDLSCLMHLQARAEARQLPLQFEHLAERLEADQHRPIPRIQVARP